MSQPDLKNIQNWTVNFTCKNGVTLVPNLMIILKLATQSMQPMHHPISNKSTNNQANTVQDGTRYINNGNPTIPISSNTYTGTALKKRKEVGI